MKTNFDETTKAEVCEYRHITNSQLLLYKKNYRRGWAASIRGALADNDRSTPLDRADARNEKDAWYDGYMDCATGRKEWHMLFCRHHETCP